MNIWSQHIITTRHQHLSLHKFLGEGVISSNMNLSNGKSLHRTNLNKITFNYN